jgi:ketosteroid isomerase-like protein
MKKTWTRTFSHTIVRLVAGALVFSFALSAYAQDKSQPTSTVEAWKAALPKNETDPNVPDATDTTATAPIKSVVRESSAQIEKRLATLERRWMEAVKLRDDAALKRLLADDFTLTSARSAGDLVGKTQYIENTLRDWKLDAYSFDKLTVRVYGDTAIVHAWYKQQATVGGKAWNGDFLLTDVWVKQGRRWQVVSRHASQPLNAQ